MTRLPHGRLLHGLNRRGDERGALSPAIPVIAFVLLLLGGLGIDSSRQLNARGQATAFAEEAARAGAQGVNLRFEQITLDPALVQSRVADYCSRVRTTSPVTECRFVRIEPVSATDPRPLVVVTEVELEAEATLLKMVGVNTLGAGAVAKARPYEGIGSPFRDG